MTPPVSTGTVFRWAVAASLGAALVTLGLLAVWTVRDILVLALVALFIAVSLDPAVRFLVRRGVNRPWAVTIILLLAVAVVASVLALVMPPLIREATDLSQNLPRYLSDLDERSQTFRDLSERYNLDEQLQRLAQDLPERIGVGVLSFFQRFVGVVASSVLVLVVAIYFMAALPRIRRLVPRFFPQRFQPRAHLIVDVVVDKVGSYMIGGLLISTIAAIVAYAILMIFRVPAALPLALLVFVTAFIPLIGATLGSIICFLVASIANGLWPSGVLVLACFIVYQQIENYIIAPRVMQGRMDLPAVAVLLAGLLGGTLIGLVGALMAIPIAAAIKAIIWEIRATSGRSDRELEQLRDQDEAEQAPKPAADPADE